MNIPIYSQTLTLAAGAQTDLISIVGNCVAIFPSTANEYTTDIQLKIDDGGFRNIPTGTKIKLAEGETFRAIQLRNSGGTSKTFQCIALMGDVANSNLSLSGDITVAQVTIDDATPIRIQAPAALDVSVAATLDVDPVGGTLVQAFAGNVAIGADSTATISSSAREIIVTVETTGATGDLIIKDSDGTTILAYVNNGQTLTMRCTNQTLKLRAATAAVNVAICEVQ